MHCRWKACVQTPHTTGLSSPGYLPSGGQPSKFMRQMPHTSSPAWQRGLRRWRAWRGACLCGAWPSCLARLHSPAPHVQAATACHFLIFTSNADMQSITRVSRVAANVPVTENKHLLSSLP